jgi:glutathione S-transferase
MRVLYHFPTSVFSRRARLALAHKGLDVELRDARADESILAEARRLTPLRTMPILVDGDHALGDSGAIAQYLDLAYPDRPALWPRGADAAHEALSITTAVDVAMNALVDMGTRNWELRHDPAWGRVLGERIARAQAAIDSVAAKATRPILAGDAWGAAEIWTLSAALWVGGLPARAATAPLVAQILTLGFHMPEKLIGWAKQHEGRPEVRAIYG